MAGDWSEEKHPRANDGKFGAGGGAPKPAARPTKAARARAAAVSAKARTLVSDARGKAKAIVAAAAAKRSATLAKAKSSGRKLTPVAKAKIATARAKAKDRAKAIVEKAKARAAAMKAKSGATGAGRAAPAGAGRAPPRARTKSASNAQVSDRDLATLREKTARISTPEESAAQVAYSAAAYIAINGQLRSGSDATPEVAKLVEHLDSLMRKSTTTDSIVTYRGARTNQSYADLQVGQVLHDKAYVSTSTERRRAFAGNYLFVITSPAGTKVAAIKSSAPSEKEMLLGRGAALRLDRREVVKDRGKDRHVMHFTVVGQH